MRREADFVLEKAAWPTLLLEGGGGLCRANQAARRTFVLPDNLPALSLSTIWDVKNSASADQFLREQSDGSTSQIKLRVAGDQTEQFVAHVAKVARDGQDYFLLQLFKDSGSALAAGAPAPATRIVPPKEEKSHVFAPFIEAGWPAILVEKPGKIVQANPAAARLFGAKAVAEGLALAGLFPTEEAAAAGKILEQPRQTAASPLKLRVANGEISPFRIESCSTGDGKGIVLQFFKDPATEAEKKVELKPPPQAAPTPPVEAALRGGVEASLAHKQKLDCALQLARSVALDFNNALTSILGHTSLLLSKAEPSHPWRGSLVEIEKSAAKAAEIANDLAAFSRQEKDLKVQVSGNVNLLLERTVEIFQGSMQGSIKMSLNLERKLFTANFDEAKMQQAMVKIFENAVESITGAGKISVQTRNVELTESTQDRTAKLNAGNYVCVEVSDNGAGIAEDVLPRIFEPFFTTKGAGHRGLGLAWVYGIVTNHGGGVAVSSQVGVGTGVRLYLPANRKIVRDAPAADGDLTGTQTVLIVDDEDLLLTMGRMVLSSYGYTVLTANSGQKALEFFAGSKKKIDLVITDLVMPNMSGRELGEHILRAAPGTKIIWSSGYVRSANDQEQERYLQKPFSAQDLLRKVKQVLAQ